MHNENSKRGKNNTNAAVGRIGVRKRAFYSSAVLSKMAVHSRLPRRTGHASPGFKRSEEDRSDRSISSRNDDFRENVACVFMTV
jgi:hypothetical protein